MNDLKKYKICYQIITKSILSVIKNKFTVTLPDIRKQRQSKYDNNILIIKPNFDTKSIFLNQGVVNDTGTDD